MRVLSLFSGGGLGDYGLELAGMEIVGQVEIDDYCQKILAIRWPEVPRWKDIKKMHTPGNCPNTHYEHERICADCLDLKRIDLISGGFPCQDISTAGKGAGITGERSGLWKEMLRVIREVRPRYVLVENVTALLGRGLGTVLGDLAESRYDAEWDCIPACAVGAPHRRDRVWIVAHAVRGGRSSEPRKQQEKRSDILDSSRQRNVADAKSHLRWARKKSEQPSGKASGKPSGNSRSLGNTKSNPRRVFDRECKENGNHWATEPAVGRVAHGTPKRMDRLKCLGNGQVVQVVEYIGKRIMEFDKTGRV